MSLPLDTIDFQIQWITGSNLIVVYECCRCFFVCFFGVGEAFWGILGFVQIFFASGDHLDLKKNQEKLYLIIIFYPLDLGYDKHVKRRTFIQINKTKNHKNPNIFWQLALLLCGIWRKLKLIDKFLSNVIPVQLLNVFPCSNRHSLSLIWCTSTINAFAITSVKTLN